MTADQKLELVTRLLIGVLRQQAQTTHGAVRTIAETQQTARSPLPGDRAQQVERAASLGRLVLKQEFMKDEDAPNFVLRFTRLVDDLTDKSGKEGDYEITVHPVDASRFSELNVVR